MLEKACLYKMNLQKEGDSNFIYRHTRVTHQMNSAPLMF